jgi:ribosomal protein S25
MKVVCPACSTSQDYIARNDQKRKRKCCCSCKKKFEIKITRREDYINKKSTQATDAFFRTYNLTELDKRILDMIQADRFTTQRKIAKKTEFDISTISRHLTRLEKLQVIIPWSQYPRLFDVKMPAIMGDEKKAAVSVHNLRVRCNITEGTISPVTFDPKDMNHWVQKTFSIGDLKIQLNNDKSVVYSLNGVGRTPPEAIDDAKNRSIKVKDFIESKFSCKLTMPMDYLLTNKPIKVHGNTIKLTDEKLKELKDTHVWVDHTPEDRVLETDDMVLLEEITANQQIIKEQQTQGRIDLSQISAIVKNEISNSLNQFKLDITKEMAAAVGTSVSAALKDLFNPGAKVLPEEQHLPNSPNDYI